MAIDFAQEDAEVTPAKLTGQAYESIGRIIRAMAEIEDILTLFILKLSRLNEAPGVVLLGRTQLSRKLEIAQYLAKLDEGAAPQLYKEVFGTPDFGNLLDCRNAIAHGVLIGAIFGDRYCFLTTKTGAPEGREAFQVTVSYGTQDLIENAAYAENLVKFAEERLQFRALREKRFERPLLGKGHTQARKKSKPTRPPRPSPSSG